MDQIFSSNNLSVNSAICIRRAHQIFANVSIRSDYFVWLIVPSPCWHRAENRPQWKVGWQRWACCVVGLHRGLSLLLCLVFQRSSQACGFPALVWWRCQPFYVTYCPLKRIDFHFILFHLHAGFFLMIACLFLQNVLSNNKLRRSLSAKNIPQKFIHKKQSFLHIVNSIFSFTEAIMSIKIYQSTIQGRNRIK